MRRSHDSEWWLGDNGELIGINLGADFTSEHEWGIKGINRSLGITDDVSILGIKKRTVSKFPQDNIIFESCKINKQNYTVLLLIDSWIIEEYKNKPMKDWLSSEVKPYRDEDLVCAWDEKSFGILVSDKYKNELQTLYKAFQDKDIAVGIGGGHAFKNGGLKFTIVSKLPKVIIDEIYNADLDYENLQKTAKATGIYEILDKAGKGKYKGWMALSPRWKDEEKKEVIFWLNPEKQHIHNYGWYTVEDLKEWAEDKGKVMMVNKAK